MGSAKVLENDLIQNRSLHRENGVSEQYPVSCRIYSKSFPEGINAEVVNYHYGGACLKFQDVDIFRVRHIAQYSLHLDFFLGSHLLKSGVPVRVAWNEPSLPNHLGIQFLIETREFIERSRRYKVNDNYQPSITAKDPLDIHRTIYFKVRNFSGAGLLINTSLTNKHLFPGMFLRKAVLSVPGQNALEIDLKIENARQGDSDSTFDLGVSIQSDQKIFRTTIQTYMNHLVPDADIAESLVAGTGEKMKSQLASGLTFRIITGEKEYEEVLKLRLAGYGVKGKVKTNSSLADQGDGLANEGTVLGAYLSGKLVASMELRFGANGRPLRVLKHVAPEVWRQLNLDVNYLVEMNKLVVHPQAQGTDVLIGMVQKAHAICLAKGAPDVILFATDVLKEMYIRLGAQATGVDFPHPYLENTKLHLLLLTKDAFLEGRFMKSEVWAKYYEETNKFYDERVYPNRSIRPKRESTGLLKKLTDLVNSEKDRAVPRENFSLSVKSGDYIDPKWTKQHFSAPVIITYLLAGDRIIGSDKVDEILSELGMSRAYFASQNNWISVEFLDAFLDVYSRYGDIDEVSRMSGILTFDKEVIGLNYYILRHFLSPEIAFKAMGSALRKFNLTRTWDVDMEPGRCLVKIGLVAREFLPKHRCSELNWLENIRAYINVLTKGHGEVKQISSVYDGNAASIFEVSWPVLSLRKQIAVSLLQFGSLGGAVSALLGYALGPESAVLGFILAVVVEHWRRLLVKDRRNKRNMEDVTMRINDINEDNTRKYQDLQNAKQRLDKRYIEAQLLDESARMIQSCDELNGIHRTALKTVCQKFGFSRAFIMTADEERKFLKTVAIEGAIENSEQLWQYKVGIEGKRDGALFLSSSFHSGQAVVINDLESHFFQLNEQSQKVIKGLGGVKGFTIIPIPDAVGSCGVLIADRDTVIAPIKQEDIVVLQRLCQHLGIAIERFSKLEKEQKLRTLFQKYVPQAVLDSLLKESTPSLGGVQKEIVCMFLDIRGFTRMSSVLPPKVVLDILNRVFAVVGNRVEESGGVIDKFLGDGVLSIWGSVPGGKCDVREILAAIQHLEEDIAALNTELVTEGLPPVSVGIGLHKGPAIVGNIGSVDRLEFTCIGNAVNLASRLEGLCKQYETTLVVSESTCPEAADLYGFRRIEDVAIRGLEHKVNIFVQETPKKNANRNIV